MSEINRWTCQLAAHLSAAPQSTSALHRSFIINFMKGSITDESTRLGMSVDGKESFTKFNNQILKSEGK